MFNIITRKTLLFYCEKYPKAQNSLLGWYHELVLGEFNNFQELKAKYSNTSIVFNISGNNYRLMVQISFKFKVIQIKWFGTHSEYDKINAETINFKI
jgi:mRNA interferase HigB